MTTYNLEGWGFKNLPSNNPHIWEYEAIDCPNNRMTKYLLWPGIFIYYIDLYEIYQSHDATAPGKKGYRITYCHEGNYFTYIQDKQVLMNQKLFIGKAIPDSRESFTNRKRSIAFTIIISPTELEKDTIPSKIAMDFIYNFQNIQNVGTVSEEGKLIELSKKLIFALKNREESLIAIKTLELLYSLSTEKITRIRSKYYQESQENIVETIEAFLRNNLNENIKLDKLCEKFLISKSNLNMKFIRKYQYTPMKYLNNLRMMRAQELLIQTDADVLKIAEKVGFLDPSNFSRSFKRYTGMSPSKYRKLHQ